MARCIIIAVAVIHGDRTHHSLAFWAVGFIPIVDKFALFAVCSYHKITTALVAVVVRPLFFKFAHVRRC